MSAVAFSVVGRIGDIYFLIVNCQAVFSNFFHQPIYANLVAIQDTEKTSARICVCVYRHLHQHVDPALGWPGTEQRARSDFFAVAS